MADRYHVTIDELCGRNRSATVARARAALCWELRRKGLSYPEIGRLVGRDHRSVMSAVEVHEARIVDAAVEVEQRASYSASFEDYS